MLRVFQELELPFVMRQNPSSCIHGHNAVPVAQTCSAFFGLGRAARAVSKVTSEKDPTDGWTIGSNNVVADTQGRTR